MRPAPLLRLSAVSVILSLAPSCAIYDGGGGQGIRMRVGESAEIVERNVSLISVDESLARVRIGSGRKIRELTLGHCEPVDYTRGLVVNATDTKGQSARISGFRITRTLDPFQPF